MADDISTLRYAQTKTRWQNELNRSLASQSESVNTLKIFGPYNSALSTAAAASTAVSSNKPEQKRSPVNFQGKSPGACGSTMSNGGSGGGGDGDRFIPNRASLNLDSLHYEFQADDGNENERSQNYRSTLAQAMQLKMPSDRLFSYQPKRPLQFIENRSSTDVPMNGKPRYIPNCSDRMLDAPQLNNNFYLNLLDWSASNIVALPLGPSIYCWNADTSDVQVLCEYNTNHVACSLAWMQQGPALAVGLKDGTVELWDADAKKRLRSMNGHAGRTGSLAWNAHVLTSGGRDGAIIHHDVRVRDNKIATKTAHTAEVCGLKWSTDFKYLASGGDDNLVNIWPSILGTNGRAPNDAIFRLDQHKAAIRAIAWCPWQSNLLATGGGASDRTIKLWNINNGHLINSVDAKSQVPALLWSKTYRELISAHGYPHCQLTIWKYPSMKIASELTGHEQRILQLSMSPDGSTIISASADETLRIWKCFAPDMRQANKKRHTVKFQPSLLRPNIR